MYQFLRDSKDSDHFREEEAPLLSQTGFRSSINHPMDLDEPRAPIIDAIKRVLCSHIFLAVVAALAIAIVSIDQHHFATPYIVLTVHIKFARSIR